MDNTARVKALLNSAFEASGKVAEVASISAKMIDRIISEVQDAIEQIEEVFPVVDATAPVEEETETEGPTESKNEDLSLDEKELSGRINKVNDIQKYLLRNGTDSGMWFTHDYYMRVSDRVLNVAHQMVTDRMRMEEESRNLLNKDLRGEGRWNPHGPH